MICLGLGAVAGLLLIALLILNQVTTGLANDQGILFFWNFANIEKLARWGALPFVIVLYQDFQQMVAATSPFSIHTVIFLIESFRLDLVLPMIIGGADYRVAGDHPLALESKRHNCDDGADLGRADVPRWSPCSPAAPSKYLFIATPASQPRSRLPAAS